MASKNKFRAKTAERILKAHPGVKDGLRTPCTSAVLRYLGVTNWRYSQHMIDMTRILRNNGYAVRSRRSQAGLTIKPEGCPTVSQLRKMIKTNKVEGVIKEGREMITQYVVAVNGHVLLLDWTGATVVDTDPRGGDRRRVRAIYAVACYYAKGR